MMIHLQKMMMNDDDADEDDDDDVEPFDTGWCRGLRESFGLRLHPPFLPSTWLAPTAKIGCLEN